MKINMTSKIGYIKGIVSGLSLSIGLLLILTQMQYGWITFSSDITKRIFVLFCYALMSFSFAPLLWSKPKIAATYSIIAFLVLSAASFITGVGLDMLSSGGVDFGVPIGNSYFMLDSLGSKVTDWVPVIKTIFSFLPAIIVVIEILLFLTGDTPDEYMSVIIEVVITVALFGIVGLVGKYAGFGFT